MTPYQFFANLTNDEYDQLKADIAANGVRDPVELDEDGNVLDGHHRKAIADDLGVPYPTVIRAGWTEVQKRDHIIALHFGRRNLTPDQRRQFVRQFKEENPKATTREIAAKVGVTPMTVSRDISPVTDVTGERRPDPRADMARSLQAENPGMKQFEIAAQVGASQGAVSNWLHAPAKEEIRKAETRDWKSLADVMESVETLSRADAATLAATVPSRRRQTTARRLREEGMLLGRIADRLEQLGRMTTG